MKDPAISRIVLAVLILVLFGIAGAQARTRFVSPEDDLGQELLSYKLSPGDTVLFQSGEYVRETALYLEDIIGLPGKPIVIGTAPGAEAALMLDSTYTEFVVYDWDHNVIHMRNCHWVEIFGLELTAGRSGIETEYTNSNCTFRDLHIHHVGNVGIRIANGANSYMKVIGCHIHDTYQHGEGFYIGDSDGSSDINHCLFEGNYVHHTSLLNNQGDGLELKKGCWANTVRHNVFHDTHYPGILCWGTGLADPQYNNKIYGNLVFSNRIGESGMQIASETDVYNNIIFDGGNRKMYSGIQSNQNTSSGTSMNHVRIWNNTIFAVGRGVRLWNWQGKEGNVFANNAVYGLSESDVAVSTDGSDLSSSLIVGNYYYGSLSGAGVEELDDDGLTLGSNPDEVFALPVNSIEGIDLYPLSGSELVGGGSLEWSPPDDDFNQSLRATDGPPSVGAYEPVAENNPGWSLAEDFKTYEGDEITSPELPSCDFNGDGIANIVDVIALLLFQRDNPGYSPTWDYNQDANDTSIVDVITLILMLMRGECSDGAMLASALVPESLGMDISSEDKVYLLPQLDQLPLDDNQKAQIASLIEGGANSRLPKAFSLGQNAPNPFNPSTTVEYNVPEGYEGNISLTVYDLRGKRVATLVSGAVSPGTHRINWNGVADNGSHAASGVYFLRLDTPAGEHVRKMVLLK